MNSGWKVLQGALLVSALAGCAGNPSRDEPSGSAPGGQGSLALDPTRACELLADQGLDAAGAYRATVSGVYVCSSFEKTIPAGETAPDTLRFFAQGSQTAVKEVRVELALKSPGDVQVAFRHLLQSVQAMTRGALGAEVPDAAQVAIRSGVTGSWPVGGATLTVERGGTFTNGLVVSLR